MNDNKFWKIFCIAAFLILMVASCYATVESLHLLLPSWPIIPFWAITIIFFVVSSLGTKMISDSLNTNINVDGRRSKLIGGILLLVFFWGFFSLPTNTHTLFYKSTVSDVLTRDLTETRSTLQDLANEGQAGKIISEEKEKFRNEVRQLFAKFSSEFYDPSNPGWGGEAENVIAQIEAKIGTIQRIEPQCASFSCREKFMALMRKQIIDEKLESKIKAVYDVRLANINRGLDKSEINQLIDDITDLQEKISESTLLVKGEPSEKTTNMLSRAYKIIEKYSDILIAEFDEEYPEKMTITRAEKVRYAGISETEKLRSVVEVWKDYFAGKFTGRGFTFWVALSALVDIAGFIFFGQAFKTKEY